MTQQFKYDVFISYSSKDKNIIIYIAEQLDKDGIKVWFDDWQLQPGDSIPAKIEDGLENSRLLLMCYSKNAAGSDWSKLESYTYRFRDPLNKERRFLPLRLDNVEVKDSLAQFLFIDWSEPENRQTQYQGLLKAFKGPQTKNISSTQDVVVKQAEKTLKLRAVKKETYYYLFLPEKDWIITGGVDSISRISRMQTGELLNEFKGHSDYILWLQITSDHKTLITASMDGTVRFWDTKSGECIKFLRAHTSQVNQLKLSQNQKLLVSCSTNTVKLWRMDDYVPIITLNGHGGPIEGVYLLPNQKQIISASIDSTLRIWDTETGQCQHILEGHKSSIWRVKVSPDGRYALSCGSAADSTVRLWHLSSGKCIAVFEDGINEDIGYLEAAWHPSGKYALTPCTDGKVRLWDIRNTKLLAVLEGHIGWVRNVSWNADKTSAISGDSIGTICYWDLSEFISSDNIGHTFQTTELQTGEMQSIENRPQIADHIGKNSAAHIEDQKLYTNAKVLLVGNSSAGKTGLANRLAKDTFEPTDSTIGAWATQWDLPVASKSDVEREIWLWDFGGQADQRLIHQLYMDQTHLVVLVFDPQKNDILDTLLTWQQDLSRAATQDFSRLLVAGRIDAGGLRSLSRTQIDDFVKQHGFGGYIETSAKENIGCEDLKQGIAQQINWDLIAQRTSPVLFRRLKQEIIKLKDAGRVLMRFNELREALLLRLSDETNFNGSFDDRFEDDDLNAVISLLVGPGVIWDLGFGAWLLLQPEMVNFYAQLVIRTLREDERELGCIAEQKVLNGELSFPEDAKCLPEDEERIILLAMHQILVKRGLCLRNEDPLNDTPTMLIFPSYVRRERPELQAHPSTMVSYTFSGFLDEIYATLVVRLHHIPNFERDQLWRDAADFKTLKGKRLGFKMTRLTGGRAELCVYFDPDIPTSETIIFSKYIHEHLNRNAQEVERLRHYVCQLNNCNTPVENRKVAMYRLRKHGKDASIVCVECEQQVPLWDALEGRFADEDVIRKVNEMEHSANIILDNESKERLLVADVMSTVALAGHTSREFTVSDHGIDMEVEFKDDAGNATGKKLYLQLKSGDSYLNKRKKVQKEIFKIQKQRHAKYWMQQAFPVMLAIRSSEGDIRWMEISEYLRDKSDNGKKAVKTIEFNLERFDVMNVRRWRERL